jgi:outer membrane protein OmpA-like peptidoglycan-associated protein
VNETLRTLKSNWQDVSFSIEVSGMPEGAAAATTGSSLQVKYLAAQKGYLTYLRVSSHGDMVATRVTATAATDSGTLELPIQAPLGRELTMFLFSDRPLTALTGGVQAQLGSDRNHAISVVHTIMELQSQGLIAFRWIDYMVDAPEGQTQYNTRSIMRMVVADKPKTQRTRARSRGFPTRIEFQFNSDRLNEASQLDLDVFGAAMLEMPDRKVLLDGYADAYGSDAYDLQLSKKRAVAAQRYLVDSFGVSAARIEAAGKGKLGSKEEPEKQRRNYRRVDFFFCSPDAPVQRSGSP